MFKYKRSIEKDMKKALFIILIALLVATAGCSKKADNTITGKATLEIDTKEDLTANELKLADEKAENILNGLSKADYAMFSRDFSDNAKKSLDREYFTKLSRFLKENSGDYVSKTLAFSKSNNQLGYDCQFSKESVLLGMTLTSDLSKVETLYLDSGNMRNRLAGNLDFA